MTDLARLRELSMKDSNPAFFTDLEKAAFEAADTIASLRKQLEDAREVALEQAARVAEEAPITGPTLSSWINANESPMGATRRHIATAIRALKGQQHG